MTIRATCHCGNVSIELPTKPESITSCNCSVCGRFGAMWAYYDQSEVSIQVDTGMATYRRGDKELDFGRCHTCGCLMYWIGNENSQGTRMGINTRMIVPRDVIADVPVKMFDGAESWSVIEHSGWGGF